MAAYRADLPIRPGNMLDRPISDKGYPVPYFVAYVDGKPDFRVIDPAKLRKCVKEHRCWLCGHKLPREFAFVVGPMCIVNRISSEPPSHVECARYAAHACPFLTLPKAHRRTANLPDNTRQAGGLPVKRNPGVTAVWFTNRWEWHFDGGRLFRIGEPSDVEYYAEGRLATRAELDEAFWSGVELLREMAKAQGAAAVVHLDYLVEQALPLLGEKQPF